MARTRTLFKRQLLTVLIPLVGGMALFPKVANGQIVPDETLGEESSTVRQDNVKGIDSDIIEGGATRGTNLFHSFTEFNVEADRGAYFANPDTIDNILSRVTGSNISEIMGTLGVLNGDANLFLINPNGIVFGENARLDVGGSFFASTADSLLFDNGFEFSGNNPEAPPLLTVNIPVGLGFRDNPGEIVNHSYLENSTDENVALEVASGQNLTLVGGNINFDRGQAIARGGKIKLGGLSAAGIVGISDDGSLNFPENVAKADISLSNAAHVDVRGTGGGSITLNAGNLNLEAGEFSSSFVRAGITADSTSAEAQAGDIIIDVAENITLNNSRITNQVDSEGVGNSGNITIFTTSLEATNRGQVSSSTSGRGNAGQVNINASDTISVDGEDLAGYQSEITSTVNLEAVGNAGGVTITTVNLNLTNGGKVSASTFAQGDAGKVKITASDTISADGETKIKKFNSGIFSRVVENTGVGNAGDIEIATGSMSLTNGGQVSTSTLGQGNAGSIKLSADNLSLNNNSKISAATTSGSGGNIPLFSQNLRSLKPESLPHLGLTLMFAPAVKRQSVVRVPA